MAEIYISPSLINEEYLKAYSPIPLNFNWDNIRMFCNIAEEIWIVPIIGRALYDELIEQVNQNNVTDVNSSLLIKIYMLEAMAIVYESLPFIRSHISEVGITLGKSDNSDSISSTDTNNLLNHLRSQLEVLKSQLKEFLDKNKDCYPLYRSDDDCCSSTNTNECDNFALFLWNTNDLSINDKTRTMYWYSLYQKLNDRPNIDTRIYPSKRHIPFLN